MGVGLESLDLSSSLRDAFDEYFPGVIADGVLDAARLGSLLGIDVTSGGDGRERYGLMWAGKQEAVRSLLTPSRGTLGPDLANSVDWDTAQNVFVEGDSLEVLKLMQKAYNDRVKLVYIDPPYNTGNDFVYNDDFSDGLNCYLEYTGQVDRAGNRVSADVDATGRRHSRWLSMMYPRLVLARNLLTQDGVFIASIDSNEVNNLKLTLDEVFGSENYLNTMVWASNLKGRQISDGGAVVTHEYLLCYARNAGLVGQFRGSQSDLRGLMPAVYKGTGYELKRDSKGPYVTKNELYNTNSKFNELTAPTMIFRIHYNPDSGEVRVSDIDDETTHPGFVTAMPHRNARPDVKWHAWRWSRAKILAESEDLEFDISGGSLRIRTKIRDVDGTALKDLIVGPSTGTGQADLEEIGLGRMFDNPKPVSLLQVLVAATTGPDDLVLDFFAGSATTAHAVAVQNAKDGGRRRCISINLPEPTAPGSTPRHAGFEKVSDITLERIRRVMGADDGAAALGLRTMSLEGSNFRQGESEGDKLFSLDESTLVEEEFDIDAVAAEVLLKEGVTLDARWERQQLDSGEIVVADGVAVVLTHNLDDVAVEKALDLEPRVVVFLEDGFAGADAVKANAFTASKNLGITMKAV